MDLVNRMRLQAEDLHALNPVSETVKCLSIGADEIARLREQVESRTEEVVALAEQNEKMREALRAASQYLPVGVVHIAEAALSLTDLATTALNRIKREGMLDAAEICKQIEAEKWQDFADKKLAVKTYGAVRCANEIYERADELYQEVKL